MKKILSLLASLVLTSTAASTIVSCSNTEQKKDDNNNKNDGSNTQPSNAKSYVSFDDVCSKWDKYKSSYIKGFMSQNLPIEVSNDQLSNIAQNMKSPEKINDNNITDKIISAFIPKTYVWGLTNKMDDLDKSTLSFVFTNIHEKSGYADYDAPDKSLCWTGNLSSSTSKKQIKLSGWFVENKNNFSIVNNITDENESQVFAELNSYDSEGKNINAPGYFLSLNFSGKKDANNFLISDETYTVNLTEANSKIIAYLTSYLRALGIVDVNYSPLIKNYNFNFLENEGTVKNDSVEIKGSAINGSHSWVHPGTIGWKNDSSSSIKLVGSILIEGYQY